MEHLYLLVGLESKIVEVDLYTGTVIRTITEISRTTRMREMRFSVSWLPVLREAHSLIVYILQEGKCSPDGELFVSYLHDNNTTTCFVEGNLYRLTPKSSPASLEHSPLVNDKGEASFIERVMGAPKSLITHPMYSLSFKLMESLCGPHAASPQLSSHICGQGNFELKAVLPSEEAPIRCPRGSAWINNNVIFVVDSFSAEIRRIVFVADQIQVYGGGVRAFTQRLQCDRCSSSAAASWRARRQSSSSLHTMFSEVTRWEG